MNTTPDTTKRPVLLLLVGGIVLSLLGLLPLLEVGYMMRQTAPSDKIQVLLALTKLDTGAITLSALLVAIGGGLLALHWIELPAKAALKTVKVLAIASTVAALANAVLLTCVASRREPDTPWKAETYADHESLFEHQVNDVFCHAKGRLVCELGSVAEGRQIFPLQNWPVDSNRVPGRRIATSCEGFKDSVQLWDYQDKMELCRLCSTIMLEEQQLEIELGVEYTAEVLAAVERPSFGELQWCGEYLTLRRRDHDVGRSPYWNHRREFQAMLVYESPPYNLFVTVLVLPLLEVVTSLCCLALVRWIWALQMLILVRFDNGRKIEVV